MHGPEPPRVELDARCINCGTRKSSRRIHCRPATRLPSSEKPEPCCHIFAATIAQCVHRQSSGLSTKSNHSPIFLWFLRNSHGRICSLQRQLSALLLHSDCTIPAKVQSGHTAARRSDCALFDERRRVQPRTLVQLQLWGERRDVAIPLSFSSNGSQVKLLT